MLRVIKQLFFTIIRVLACGAIGMWLALPLSYFFQSGIYSEMTFWEYVKGGRYSVFIGAEFGAWDVYRYCVVASVTICVTIGGIIDYLFKKKQ